MLARNYYYYWTLLSIEPYDVGKKKSTATGTDVLVKWSADDSINVVSWKDLVLAEGDRDTKQRMWKTRKRGNADDINALTENYTKHIQKKVKDDALEVTCFANGCSDQIKNSILAILLYFLRQSENISAVTIQYFETNHGQFERDSIHSTVQRAIKRTEDISYLPS